MRLMLYYELTSSQDLLFRKRFVIRNLMGLPGHRRTSSHKRRRAAHFALSDATTTKCGHCNKAVLPHHVCPHCGYYKGRPIIKLKIKNGK